MQMVLLNGPRGVGKNSAADAMMRPGWLQAPVMRQIKRATLEGYGIGRDLLPVYESLKDVPLEVFGNKSFRQAVIGYSQRVGIATVVKVWMDDLVRELEYAHGLGADDIDTIVVPDVRFFEEYIAAVEYVGARNVYVVRVKRPGHGWEGDVGSYLHVNGFGSAEVTIMNDQDEAYFKLETAVFAQGFVSQARRLFNAA